MLYVRGSREKINSFLKFPPPPQIITGRPLNEMEPLNPEIYYTLPKF